MKLSAQDVMKGMVPEVQRGAIQSVLSIGVQNPAVVFATIGNALAEQLGLLAGAAALVMIRATDVIVGTE